MTKYVTKRKGNKEEFKVCKLKEMISWACYNLDVNPLVLESSIDYFFHDNITTSMIHDNLIYHARTLCTVEQPEWATVAGRLRTMRRWKTSMAYDIEWVDFFKERIETGDYAERLYTKYSDEDIILLGEAIEQDRDLQHSYSSVVTAESKYLLQDECIQQMFMATAMAIASVEDKPVEAALKFYEALSKRKVSLATPWLSSLRKGGNISSCFIITVDDSIEALADAWRKAAYISKNGGGVGIDLSRLRAKGATIAGNSGAGKGICSWVKIFNDIAVAVDQNGKRAGAFTLAVPIYHNDIGDFLEIQTEVGDVRSKAFDIFPQVVIPDIFMEKVDSDEDWHTFCPHEVRTKLGLDLYGCYGEEFNIRYNKAVEAASNSILKVFTKYKAKVLLKEIMKIQFETGLPYLPFLDAINRHNPNKHEGFIPCVNLCNESFSNVTSDMSHTCNLLSIVAGRMEDLDDVREHGKLSVRMLDNGIALTNPPTGCSSKHNNRYRTIGVGIQGLHDYLAKNYSSYKDLTTISKFTESLEYGCVESSIELAKERGRYDAFEGSMWDTGEKIDYFKQYSRSDLDCDLLQKAINQYGIRNSQLTSPAPNTSTSIFMDAAAGVMPIYATYFTEDNKDGSIPVVAMYLKDRPLQYSKTFGKHNQVELTEAIGVMQRHIDTGISSEYLLDQNMEGFSAKMLYDLIINAWKNETKSIYYVRTIKKGNNVGDLLGVKDTDACVGCAG